MLSRIRYVISRFTQIQSTQYIQSLMLCHKMKKILMKLTK